ncbi:MAG: hypothetical protein ACI9VR_002629 [Cognaticolwellia sp.]
MTLPNWIDDRLNPILVKEVRQALRGRYFKVTYGLTLIAATLVGIVCLMAADNDPEIGQAYFVGIYMCMAAAMMGLVPFQAFVAASGSGRGGRAELLQLTALRPRQIVAGRLLSSLVQSGLVLAALAPFLALSFLLPGVDLSVLVFVVVYTLIFSVCVSCVTLSASFLTENRLLRVLLMVILGGFQFSLVSSAVAGVTEILRNSSDLQDVEVQVGLSVFAGVAIFIATFAFIGGTLRISHPEENRSTPLRVLMFGFALVGMIGTYMAMHWVPHPEAEAFIVAYLALGFAMLLPSGIFSGESERLGRRVQVTAPKNALVALAATPFMPGGGNGALFNLVIVTLFGGFMMIFPTVEPDAGDAWVELFVFSFLWAVTAFNLPTALLQRWSHRMPIRVLSAFAPGMFFAGTAMVPTFFGLMAGDRDWGDFEHPFCFPWAFERLTRDNFSDKEAIWTVALVMFVITMLVNLPRMLRGIREVQRVSRLRRENEARVKAFEEEEVSAA